LFCLPLMLQLAINNWLPNGTRAWTVWIVAHR
jgi:hypothetical protein